MYFKYITFFLLGEKVSIAQIILYYFLFISISNSAKPHLLLIERYFNSVHVLMNENMQW